MKLVRSFILYFDCCLCRIVQDKTDLAYIKGVYLSFDVVYAAVKTT